MPHNASIRSELDKQKALESELKRILAKEDLSANKAMIEVSARHLDLDYLDLAAALLFINAPSSALTETDNEQLSGEKQRAYELLHAQMVRYRIEVGRHQRATVYLIKQALMHISGVDPKRIGYIDIFDHYAVLGLPAGMPVETLEDLKSCEINGHILDIKRLNGSGKKYRTDKNYRRGTRRHYLSVNKRNHPAAAVES